MSKSASTIAVQVAAAVQIPGQFNGEVPFHPQAHTNLFMSEPLVYTNPHIWAAYLFAMVGLGIAALYFLYRQHQSGGGVVGNQSGGTRGHQALQGAGTNTPAPAAGQVEGEDATFLRLKTKHDLLLRRMKGLDQDYDSGNLEHEEYAQARERYMQLLVNVKVQLQEYVQ